MKNMIIGLALICSLVSVSVTMYHQSYGPKFIFVDTIKLYDEFEYTKQSNKELDKIIGARKNVTDSLYEAVRKRTQEVKYSRNRDEAELMQLEKVQNEYYYKKEQFESENQSTLNLYSTRIWNQLNTLVSQYSKEKNYQIVFGANGQGNIMYGTDTFDKTKELIEYVNKKFNDER